MSRDVATAWVEHLREGGATPWPRWVRTATGDAPSSATAASVPPRPPRGLPGAAQLELLRRVNELGPLPHRAEHVLSRSGPGRGPVHLRLPVDPVGPPAPRREVLRVAAGVLADLVTQLPAPARTRRRRPRRGTRPAEAPAFVLEGLPVTVAELRATLAAMGLEEARPAARVRFLRRPTQPSRVVVVAGPVDTALHEAWARRVQRGPARAWPRFVTQWSGRGKLPASAAVDAIVEHWSARIGAGNVHVVPAAEGADDTELVKTVVVEALGLPAVPAAPVGDAGRIADGDPVRLPPPTLDALRRVQAVLPFVCGADDRPARRTALLELLRDETGPAEPFAVAVSHRAWLEEAGAAVADALAGSGCVVHGDLDILRNLAAESGRRVADEEVLGAMVRMIHLVDAALLTAPRSGRGGR